MLSPTSSPSQSLSGGTSISIKPKSKKELGVEYELHPKTIASMCKSINLDSGGKKLSIQQITAFYQHFGYPGNYAIKLNIGQA